MARRQVGPTLTSPASAPVSGPVSASVSSSASAVQAQSAKQPPISTSCSISRPTSSIRPSIVTSQSTSTVTPTSSPRSGSSREPSPVRQFNRAQLLAPDLGPDPCEEERLPWYTPYNFYPARIGELLQAKYQVIAKLGHGSYSTVWLCRDLVDHRYVSVKVNMSAASVQPARELDASTVINRHRRLTDHPGLTHLTQLLDAFDVDSKAGYRHKCLVYEPLGFTFGHLRQMMPNRRFSPEILRISLAYLLQALNFLHSHAGLIHCDLQENNILVRLRNEDECLSGVEDAELGRCPSARKTVSYQDYPEVGRVHIYQSRTLLGSAKAGVPVLCDFGEARMKSPGQSGHTDLIQPLIYRAPEVILGMEWDEKVDIWNMGVLVWDVFERSILTTGRDNNGRESKVHHLAEIVSVIGRPPVEFLERPVYRDTEFLSSSSEPAESASCRPRIKRTKSTMDTICGPNHGLNDGPEPVLEPSICTEKVPPTIQTPENSSLLAIPHFHKEEVQLCRKRGPISPPGSIDDHSSVSKYFDEQGNWLMSSKAPVVEKSLELLEDKYTTRLASPYVGPLTSKASSKEAAAETARFLFIDLMKRMLTWNPKDRWSAKELLEHPWMKLEDDGLN